MFTRMIYTFKEQEQLHVVRTYFVLISLLVVLHDVYNKLVVLSTLKFQLQHAECYVIIVNHFEIQNNQDYGLIKHTVEHTNLKILLRNKALINCSFVLTSSVTK